MIRIVQGNPGSGKSYYAVNYLAKFCSWDELYKEWLLNPGVLVITNIEGLKIKHLDLESLLQRYPVEEFFTVENFERIQKQYQTTNIVVIIDEAQKIFDSKYFDKTVFYFFQYHRHLGIDIFFLTQSVSTIARHIIPLSEFIIEAQPRSKSVGVFRYKFKDQKGFYMYTQNVTKKKNVFNMYKSFSSDEAEKPKNVVLHWSLMGLAVVIICFIGGKILFHSLNHRDYTYGKKPSASHTPAAIVQRPYSSPVSPSKVGKVVKVASVAPAVQSSRAIRKKSRSVAPSVPLPSPAPLPAAQEAPPVRDAWKSVKVSAYVKTAAGFHVFIGDESISEFRNFDPHSMTAEIPVKSVSSL